MTGNSTENLWYIARDGQQHGPISQTEMQMFVENGHLKPTDLLWRPGFADWQPAASVFPDQKAAAPEKVPHKPQETAEPRATEMEAGASAQAKSQAGVAAAAQETAQKPAQPATTARSGQIAAPAKTTSTTPTATATATASTSATTKPAPAATTSTSRPVQAAQTASAPRAKPAHPSPANGGPSARQPTLGTPAPRGNMGPSAQGAAARTTAAPSSATSAAARASPYEPAGSRAENARTSRPRGRSLVLAAILVAIIGGSFTYVISHKDQIMALVGGGEPGSELPLVKARSAPPATAQQETATLQHPEPSDERAAARQDSVEPVQPPPSTITPTEGPAPGTAPGTTEAQSTVTPTAAPSVVVAPPAVEATSSAAALDAYYQQSKLWQYMKRVYPDWYREHIDAAAALGSGSAPQRDATKSMVEGLVALRRQHAENALHADVGTLKAIATAFLNNLQSLSERGPDTCYGFISQGETSPKSVDLFHKPQSAPELEGQALSIFEAIAVGTASPAQHERPKKGDYDILAAELGKLGWSQADLQLFADPKALTNAPPARVCTMVRDWFKAHIAIPDTAVQERLLVETLRPVVAG